MASVQENILEAQRRGLITPELKAKIVQAQRAGLLKSQTIAPIPEASVQELPGQRTPANIRAGTRGAAIAGGATLGAELGTVGGPVGMLAGAALGAGGGALFFDSLEDVNVALSGRERTEGSPEPGVERLESALGEATLEAGFTAGTSSLLLFPIKRFLTPLLGKVFGARQPTAKLAVRLAKIQGINLGAVDVGNVVARGFARVLGIFPYTGTPLRKARAAKEAQSFAAIDRVLNDLAPTATLSGEVGVDLASAARNSRKEFDRVSGVLYDNFRQAMNGVSTPEIIPTQATRKSIASFVDEIEQGGILINGKELAGRDAFEQFLTEARKLPDLITFKQFIRLQRSLEGFVDGVTAKGFDVKRVAKIKQAMEADLDGMRVDLLPEGEGAALREIKEAADTFYSNGILVFQTPTAGKFGRVDKGIVKAGGRIRSKKAGPPTLNPDEIMKPVFNADSATALRDLRELVGNKAFSRASRTHMEDALSKSIKTEVRGGKEVEVFDPDRFANALGLVRGMKNREAALEEILKGAAVTIDDFKELVTAMRNISAVGDANSFIVRRVTLGGVGAIGAVAGFGGAAAKETSLTFGLMIGLATRRMSRLLADREGFKALTRAFSPSLDEVTRRALVVRAFRKSTEDRGETGGQRPKRRRGGKSAAK